MRRLAALGLSILLGALACRGGEEAPESPGAPAPPETAEQPDRPLLGRSAGSVTERFRKAPDGRWSEARDVAVDREGALYVLDAVLPARILKFDAEGRYLLRFGEDEPQPAVVQVLGFSLAPEWNTMFVVDRSDGTVATYLTLGMLSRSVRVTGGVALDAVSLPALGEYYLHGWNPTESRVGVYHMRFPVDTLATTYEVAIPLAQPVKKTARDIYFRTAADRRGRLYVAFYDGYPVRALKPSGETALLMGIDREPVVRSAKEVAAETAENLAKLRAQAPEVADSILVDAARADSVLPIIDELAVDPTGRLWVRTNRQDTHGTTPYDVFDERGRYLARVDVPGDVRATAFAPDGRLFVIDAAGDPAGVVVGYDVRLGTEVPAPPAGDTAGAGGA